MWQIRFTTPVFFVDKEYNRRMTEGSSNTPSSTNR